MKTKRRLGLKLAPILGNVQLQENNAIAHSSLMPAHAHHTRKCGH